MNSTALHPDTFNFLQNLAAHNHKEWLDANRAQYLSVRQGVIDFAGQLHDVMATVAPVPFTDPKKLVGRINNNRRFHPNKPPYKTHIGLMLKREAAQLDYYLHLEPGNSFAGTGLYHPPREALHAFRAKVDREGARLQEIVAQPPLQKFFGSLHGEALKTSPRDYTVDHPYLHFLRLKDITLMRPLRESEVFKSSFLSAFREHYAAALPFMKFVDEALESAKSDY